MRRRGVRSILFCQLVNFSHKCLFPTNRTKRFYFPLSSDSSVIPCDSVQLHCSQLQLHAYRIAEYSLTLMSLICLRQECKKTRIIISINYPGLIGLIVKNLKKKESRFDWINYKLHTLKTTLHNSFLTDSCKKYFMDNRQSTFDIQLILITCSVAVAHYNHSETLIEEVKRLSLHICTCIID